MGFHCFHRTWLLVRRLGVLLARAKHNYPHDDVRRTGCACAWGVPSCTVVPRRSMSANAFHEKAGRSQVDFALAS